MLMLPNNTIEVTRYGSYVCSFIKNVYTLMFTFIKVHIKRYAVSYALLKLYIKRYAVYYTVSVKVYAVSLKVNIDSKLHTF